MKLIIQIPCYNEEKLLPETIKNLPYEIPGIDEIEILVIDDGSSDDTGVVADGLAAEIEEVKVIHHEQNSGYGAALQSGFKGATKNLVFYTDGDAQFDIAELGQLLPLIKQYDIVSCYRLDRRDNFIRKVNAWCWTKLVCLLFGMKLKDIDCAFKLFKRQIFDNIRMQSTGALIDTEILARAIRKGYTVTQVGVHHYPRTVGSQTGAKLSVIFRAFKELFHLRREILRK